MKRVLLLVAAALVLVLTCSSAQAQELTVVAQFDASLGELPEGIAADGDGNLYLSMASGEIKKVTPNGDASTFAQLPSPGDGFVTGVAFGTDGDLYVAFGSMQPDTHGIWRVSPEGDAEQFASLDSATLPNGLAFDSDGNLYVSDSFGGQVLKVTPGGQVSVWSNAPELAGPAEPVAPLPFSVGANGIAFDAGQDNLYVANTGLGTVIKVPMRADGSAGAGEVVLEDRALLRGAAGSAFDDAGTLYVTVFLQARVIVLSPDWEATTLSEGGPLQNPASVAFGAGTHATELYITNFAALRALGLQEGDPAPALFSIDVGH